MKNKFAIGISAAMALSMIFSGCEKNVQTPTDEAVTEAETEEVIAMLDETVVPSPVSGAEVMNQLWATSLDASAAIIDPYHAESVEEVLNLWKQAHMQKNDQGIVNGNGALIYAICSPDLRPRCLEIIKQNNYGSWNFYYSTYLGASDQTKVPQGIVFFPPERIEEPGMIRYIVEVSEISQIGETVKYQLFIDFIDGGYYLSGRTSPYTEMGADMMMEEATEIVTQ